MTINGGTLARYFGLQFLGTTLLVFAAIFALVALLDYIEMMRRASDLPNVSAILVAKTSLYRVPQVTERIMPFCILIGAMSCYLTLSRRLELVVARAAGMSAWQFISPALIVAFLLGVVATTVYNPISALLQERSKRYEAELFGQDPTALRGAGGTFWVSQRSSEGMAIINANSSQAQGVAADRRHRFSCSTAAANSGNESRRARRCWNPAFGGCRMPAFTKSVRCRLIRQSIGSRQI